MGARKPPASSALPSEWRTVDTCAVSDALDRSARRGVVDGLVPVAANRSIIGRAVTVEIGPSDGTRASRHLGTRAIEVAQPGDVIVVAHRGRLDCAAWGGNLSLAAHLGGLSGVVVDGACRDVAEATAVGLPIFARTATPRTARGRVRELSCQQPAVIGDVTVQPGDLVVADACGVVFVAEQWLAEVMAAAVEIVNTETAMAAAIRSGRPVSEVMGATYESLTTESKPEKPR